MKKLFLLLFTFLCTISFAYAGLITIPYSGSYDEVVVPAEDGLPAGDYDTIGGYVDVGLFNLVAGSNTFEGSVFTPSDSSDVFTIGIGANQTLTGASIAFGTNLSPFNPLFAFPPPIWTLEESDTDPTIFLIDPLGSNGQTATLNVTAPSFSRGVGIYSVLIGNGTFGSNNGAVDYTMTFNVEETAPVPIPTAILLLGSGLLGYFGFRRKFKE
jgi:hypothetical protein